MTQGKKLKNWYIQEHTTGTTFEPKHFKNALTKKWYYNTNHGEFQQQDNKVLNI